MIKIDLNDTYVPKEVSEDLKYFIFDSELANGNLIELHVVISQHPDEYLQDVYNIGFGPIDQTGEIDDKCKIKHKNVNKVFSTIILYGITFLNEHKDNFIGIDGSDDLRAYFYHRMFRYNLADLNDILSVVGVDWYVKLLRNQTDIERDTNNLPLFKPRPELFDLNRDARDLYRYYMYKLN